MTNLYIKNSARPQKPADTKRKILFSPAFLFLILMVIAGNGWGQTTVFTDDFNRGSVVTPLSNGGTPAMTYTTTTTSTGNPSGGGATSRTNLISVADYTVQILAGNSVSTPAQTGGRTYVSGSLSTYSSPFSSTLGSNTGPVTWTLNMRTNRSTALSGFGANAYVSVAVLAATNSNFMSANGYAVVLNKGTTTNAVSLVRFAGGLGSTPTTIIGPSPDIAGNTNFVSVKVIYTPSTNTWQLFVRDDLSNSIKGDPTTVTTQIGVNTVNSTYTGVAMTDFGFFWNHSAAAGYTSSTSHYDDFKVTVTPVLTPILNVSSPTMSGFSYIVGSGPSASQYYNLSGANLDGTPVNVTCATNYEMATDATLPTFSVSVNIPYTAPSIGTTKVYVRLKSGLPVGNYNSETVSNAGGGAATSSVICNGQVLPGPTLYTWQGTDLGDWTIGTNWNPTRTTPAINDLLQFNDATSKVVTNVPTQTIGNLIVSNNTTIEFQSVAPVMLTINGGAGVDLDVQSGSALTIAQATNAIVIALNTGATGTISGSMIFSTAAHRLTAADLNGITFQTGSTFTTGLFFSGNAFGATGTANSIVFANGSKYIFYAGANPFGLGAPASIVTWQTGSTYVHKSTGNPSLANRTYANFELDEATGTNFSASSPLTMDNLIVTTGIWTLGVKALFTIKNDITVAPGSVLNFNPTTVGTIALNGVPAQTITGGGTITFGAFQMVTANNNLSFGSGTITFANGSSLITNGAVSGNVIIERAIVGGEWHLISAPVSGLFSGMFLGKYLQQHSELTNAYTDILSSSTPLTAMKGFALYDAAGFTAQYNGTVNTGGQSIALTRTVAGTASGWNLVGNAYPSSIDWDAVSGWTKTNVANATYIHVNNAIWASYIGGTGTNGGTRFIAPGQGFFVYVKDDGSTSGTLGMTDAVRVHNATAFFKYAVTSLVRLQVSGNGYTDEAVVRFEPEATAEFDGNFDAHKLYGDVAEAAQLYSLGTTPMAINSLPETNTVSVGMRVGSAGVYTIEATEVNDFANISLEDTKTGVFTDLLKGSYAFSFAPGENEQRFVLHFDPLAVEEKESSFANIYSSALTVFIDLKSDVKSDILVYNNSGQLVNTLFAAQGSTRFNLENAGIYIVKVITNQKTMVKKVFVQ